MTNDPSRSLSVDDALLDAVTDLVVMFGVAPGGAATATATSASWRRAHGHAAEDRLGRSPAEVLPPASAAAVEAIAAGGLSGPLVFDDTVVGAFGAGQVEATVTATTSGDDRFVLWVARDVRAQRRAEADMRWQRDDLRRSNSDLAEFATAASHDLKEPLRMITAYLELLDRRYGEVLDERGHQYLGFARDGADRLRSMTESLLGYAKIRAAPVELAPVDLGTVMAGVEHELALTLRDAEAKLVVRPLPVVVGSALLLQTLLQNLVANAIKFSTGRPRIKVACVATPRRGC